MIGWKVLVVEKAIWSTWRTKKTCKRHLTVKGLFLCSKKQPSFSGNTQIAVRCRLKAVAAKIPRFSLRDHVRMNRIAAKDYRRITQGFFTQQQQLRAYLHTRTGKETKILSLAEVGTKQCCKWKGTCTWYNLGSLISSYGRETSTSYSSSSVRSPSASKRRKRDTFFFKRDSQTHRNFFAWQIKIKW